MSLEELITECSKQQYFNLHGWIDKEGYRWEATATRLDGKNLISAHDYSPNASCKVALENLYNSLQDTK